MLGSTVTLTVARAPEWATTWSESGTGDYDSQPIEVTVPQGKWRIVVELDPRYLIFGSGSASVSWEGTGSGQIGLDQVGSDEVAPSERGGNVHAEGAASRERQLDRPHRATRMTRPGRLTWAPGSETERGLTPGSSRLRIRFRRW